MDVQQQLDRAVAERKQNRRLMSRLRQRPPKDLDERIHALHDEAFARIDCLECANCCKTTSPIFRDIDIERLASHLGIRPAELVARYLHLDSEGDYVLNTAPCPFLGADNYCAVYAARPRACRDYPHTDRKNMVQLLSLTLRNTLVCPAVEQIVRRLR